MAEASGRGSYEDPPPAPGAEAEGPGEMRSSFLGVRRRLRWWGAAVVHWATEKSPCTVLSGNLPVICPQELAGNAPSGLHRKAVKCEIPSRGTLLKACPWGVPGEAGGSHYTAGPGAGTPGHPAGACQASSGA